ncbi:electron transfer flavoprotein subunit alpha/FixB family protein [Acetivibrio clariflavus]|uniref:electron transfer flavoprotein subunit alpha/FixB family protein n=1 Tax=Acetivibrio clariflavus TaxID=288965 RepID=UPI0004B440A7|nr:electron transfer flavoprotein subunit alpha/FixB family protein [Acetivibrio clariflavus]
MGESTIEEGGVWVISEPSDSDKFDVIYELNSIGRKLADRNNNTLTLVLIGYALQEKIEEIKRFSYDYILYAENKMFECYDLENYANTLVEMIRKYKPGVVLLGSTLYGRTIAPWIASALKTGLTADCIWLDMNEGTLIQVRPAFGDNIEAEIICPRRKPQMATVRPHVFPLAECRDNDGTCKLVRYDVTNFKTDFLTLLDRIKVLENSQSLEKAQIIFAVGRGIKSKKNLDMVFELAVLYGAQVGATRALVDMGMIDRKYQIGQTGVTVKPKLYIAFGISGCIQHMSGVLCNEIWAVNNDENAQIFKKATLGCVADINVFLPLLLNKMKE